MPNAGSARSGPPGPESPSPGPPLPGRGKIGRLRKRPEFLKVAAARAKFVTPGLILQARKRSGAAASGAAAASRGDGGAVEVRVGLTVSRKVGNAVLRNRARRRLRALADEILPALGEAGTDYVLIGRRETLARSYADLGKDLRKALRQIGRARNGEGRARRRSRPERRETGTKTAGRPEGETGGS